MKIEYERTIRGKEFLTIDDILENDLVIEEVLEASIKVVKKLNKNALIDLLKWTISSVEGYVMIEGNRIGYHEKGELKI